MNEGDGLRHDSPRVAGPNWICMKLAKSVRCPNLRGVGLLEPEQHYLLTKDEHEQREYCDYLEEERDSSNKCEHVGGQKIVQEILKATEKRHDHQMDSSYIFIE